MYNGCSGGAVREHGVHRDVYRGYRGVYEDFLTGDIHWKFKDDAVLRPSVREQVPISLRYDLGSRNRAMPGLERRFGSGDHVRQRRSPRYARYQ